MNNGLKILGQYREAMAEGNEDRQIEIAEQVGRDGLGLGDDRLETFEGIIDMCDNGNMVEAMETLDDLIAAVKARLAV